MELSILSLDYVLLTTITRGFHFILDSLSCILAESMTCKHQWKVLTLS